MTWVSRKYRMGEHKTWHGWTQYSTWVNIKLKGCLTVNNRIQKGKRALSHMIRILTEGAPYGLLHHKGPLAKKPHRYKLQEPIGEMEIEMLRSWLILVQKLGRSTKVAWESDWSPVKIAIGEKGLLPAGVWAWMIKSTFFFGEREKDGGFAQ